MSVHRAWEPVKKVVGMFSKRLLHPFWNPNPTCHVVGLLLFAVILCCRFQDDADRSANAAEPPTALPGTKPLDWTGDIASQLVEGVDRFLLRKIEEQKNRRPDLWPRPDDGRSYTEATASLRRELTERIGLKDERVPVRLWKEHLTHGHRFETNSWQAEDVRWSVLPGVDAFGLLLEPKEGEPRFSAIIVPDAGQTPEDLIGFAKDSFPSGAFLASQGARVLIPSVVSRTREARRGRANLTDQEYIYRSAFELGRHLLGYQVHECMAAAEYLLNLEPNKPLMIAGWGEGGWIALFTAAVDERIDGALVSGHFGPRENIWAEPIHRNVFGLLNRFGDAELAALVAPRTLVIDPTPGPSVELAGLGGAPGKLHGPTLSEVLEEFQCAGKLLQPWQLHDSLHLVEPLVGNPPDGSRRAFDRLLSLLHIEPQNIEQTPWRFVPSEIEMAAQNDRTAQRRKESLEKWDRFTQRLLERMEYDRADFWKNLDTSSLDRFEQTVKPYRDVFEKDIIGAWDDKLLEAAPRSRRIYDETDWTGNEVVLDVFPDVVAYGILLLPKTLEPDLKRPCVVFQHGLEGRPSDTIVGDHPAYHDVARRLVEQGYVVFCPQNLYIFEDRFRTLQRKSNALGKTLFSIMVPQHRQIARWLGSLPYVDPGRIAFYGLSYGGKSTMRIPPLVPEYCLSICSADFNDWVWKNASTLSPYSYVWTMEYEIFEFDLGPKLNYAEMANLIAPRPFMVERGHFDGVAPDHRVALEYAKVQHLYSAKLAIPDRCRIEWFVGPHTINGQGTFDFLSQHLRWPPKP